jgi:uncharacterized protein YbjT (DUF2867 family)
VSVDKSQRILVTGATGYIGGRLTPRLMSMGYNNIRVLVRDPERLIGRSWYDDVEVVEGDVLKPETLSAALMGVNIAYYLIHSMRETKDFEERDIIAARNFGNASRIAGVEHIIYLGGLGDPNRNLSSHLRSRHETGSVLRESGVPITEFRAGIIVGSGSISFEIIRYLTERIPIMLAPRFVSQKVQPIGVRNALNYLMAALEKPECRDKIIEIGDADILTYREMMLEYARIRGLRRYIIPAPLLFLPNLISYFIHLTTPISNAIAHPLIEGLRNEVVVRDDLAQRIFTDIISTPYEVSVRRALMRLEADQVETTWSDSLASSLGDAKPVVLTTHEGMLLEHRQCVVNAPHDVVYQAFISIGGQRGWPTFNYLWWLRGMMDSIVGGVGFRRGRRHPDELRAGDALDFWRVEAIEPGSLLRLRAEMKVPGRAWLQFKAEQIDDTHTRLSQSAMFDPKGLVGFIYWYFLYPIHGFIFGSMIRKLTWTAESTNETIEAERLHANE